MRRVLPRLLLAVVVATGLVVLALHQVSLADVRRAIGHVGPGLLLMAAAGAAGFMLARAWRYHVLLYSTSARRPAVRGENESRNFGATVVSTLAAWGPGLVLPTPSADAAFVWLAVTRLGTGVERAITTVVMARLLDVLSLLVVGLISAPLAGARLPRSAELIAATGVVLLLILVAGMIWRPSRELLARPLERLPFVGPRAQRLEMSFAELTRGRTLVELALSTGVARLCTAVQYMALLSAVGLPLGFWDTWFALSVRTLLLAIPVQGLAGLGTTQLWWATALALLGQPLHAAVLAGLSVHLLDLVITLSLSALGWILLVSLPRSRRPW